MACASNEVQAICFCLKGLFLDRTADLKRDRRISVVLTLRSFRAYCAQNMSISHKGWQGVMAHKGEPNGLEHDTP